MTRDTRSPITRMIDEACGYDPSEPAPITTEARRDGIMLRLFESMEDWYFKRNANSTNKLRKAWRAVLDEDERSKPPTPLPPHTPPHTQHEEE